MRILLVHQPVDGGVGRHVGDLSEGLLAAGHEVVTCGPAPPRYASGTVPHIALALERAISPRRDAALAARLAAIVRAVEPAIVHAHSSKAGALARAIRPAAPSTPVIYTPHGFAFAGHFERPAERAAYRAVEAALTPLATRILCVCEAEARLARSVGAGGRVRVVHNGIAMPPPGEPDPRTLALARSGPVICTLTQLRPGKGLETLIDAVPAVLARHPGAGFAIWGDGPDREALARRAASLGVAGAVHLLGATTDPLAALRGADVFVLPSWAESFPYVVLEAMATELPIVASDVGGVPEAIGDGREGLLVAAGDAAALAGALVSTLDAPQEAARRAAAARARAASEFTLGAMLSGVQAVYRELTRNVRP